MLPAIILLRMSLPLLEMAYCLFPFLSSQVVATCSDWGFLLVRSSCKVALLLMYEAIPAMSARKPLFFLPFGRNLPGSTLAPHTAPFLEPGAQRNNRIQHGISSKRKPIQFDIKLADDRRGVGVILRHFARIGVNFEPTLGSSRSVKDHFEAQLLPFLLTLWGSIWDRSGSTTLGLSWTNRNKLEQSTAHKCLLGQVCLR